MAGERGGFIVLSRKLFDSALWQGLNSSERCVMIAVIEMANWKDGELWLRSEKRRLPIPRGSFVASQRRIAERAAVTRRMVRSALDQLEAEGFLSRAILAQYGPNAVSMITITNYSRYQDLSTGTLPNSGPIADQSGYQSGPDQGTNQVPIRGHDRTREPCNHGNQGNHSPDILARARARAIEVNQASEEEPSKLDPRGSGGNGDPPHRREHAQRAARGANSTRARSSEGPADKNATQATLGAQNQIALIPVSGVEVLLAKRAKSADQAEDIRAVFDHYRGYHPRAHRKPHSKMKEWQKVRDRLDEGATVEYLTRAIDGMHRTPHNLGMNDHNQTYLGLELCMRSGSNVERFAQAADRNPAQYRTDKAMRTDIAFENWLRRKEQGQ